MSSIEGDLKNLKNEVAINVHETDDNPFANPEIALFYMDMYENAKYESRHWVDPDFTWSPEEEIKVKRKTDFRVVLWALVMFVALDIDRMNISAVTGSKHFFADVKITTDQYNLGMTYFYLGFLLAELPSQLLSKWIGADRFIPLQLVLWSVCAIAQCQMKSPGAFYALRVLIGVLQGGFIADTSLWMSYFYTNREFVVRSGWFYLANPLTTVFSQLLAAAILTLEGKGRWHGWQYVFLIEGLITLTVGLISFFMMPPSPTQTRQWFRPHGWYTEREEKIIVNNVLRDSPEKGGMNNRQGVGLKLLWKALSDYDLWPIYACRLLIDSGGATLGRYLPIILSRLGFSVIQIDLLQVPSSALQCVTQLLECYLVGHFNQYALVAMFVPLWIIPFVAALRWWPGVFTNVWGTYVLIFLCLSGFTTPPVLSAWCSQNSNSLRTRAVSLAVVNIAAQLGGIVNSNLFRKDDAPRYHRGLQQIFALNVAGVALVLLTRVYFEFRNKRREHKWTSMTAQERVDYEVTTTDQGNKRLSFRFTL